MNPHSDKADDRDSRLKDLVSTYLKQAESGSAPDRQTLLARHPDLADQLAVVFDNQRSLEDLATWLGKPPLTLNALIKAADTAPANQEQTLLLPTNAGVVFGDYRLLSEIARGGMGVVYRAQQISLNRIVALKMIRRGELASTAEVERFRLEAEAAAGLEHPNIVPIYEVGEHQGQHYFTMKLVEGGSLSDEGALGSEGGKERQRAAARLMATIARAVHYAHQRGILHRDLKPANILLAKEDGSPHVSDFGLAKRVDDDSALTQTGAIVGTPSYMAPEQATAKATLTTAADVYSLGAILYRLLTGEPPHKGDSALDTLLRVRQFEPRPPRALDAQIDRDLETICLKCLEKEPSRRYGSAEALADDLDRYLANEPIQARPSSTLDRLGKWARRKPAVAALTAALIALAIVSFGMVMWHWRGAVVALARAEEAELAKDKERIKAIGDRDRAQLAEQAKEFARQEEASARQIADELRRKFQRQAVSLLLDQGIRLCEQRDVARGLLYMGRGLEIVAKEDEDLERVLRSNVADWSTQLHPLKTVITLPTQIDSAALSPDGRWVVTGAGGKAQLWEAATGMPFGEPIAHKGNYVAVAMRSKNIWLTASSDGMVRFWQTMGAGKTRSIGEPVMHPAGKIDVAQFSKDGARAITAGGKVVNVVELDPGAFKDPGIVTVLAKYTHPDQVRAAALSPDGDWLLTGCLDKRARLWKVGKDSEPVWISPPCDAEVKHVALGPHGDTFVTASQGKHQLWDFKSRKPIGEPRTGKAVQVVAYDPSPKGDTYLVAAGETVRFYNAADGRPTGWTVKHQGVVKTAVFNFNSVVTGGVDQTVRVWQKDQQVGANLAHQRDVLQVMIAGKTLVSRSAERNIRVWQLSGIKPSLPALPSANLALGVVSPDGERVLAGNLGGGGAKIATVIDVASGEPLGQMPVVGASSGIFSPDGRKVVLASNKGLASLYEVGKAEPRFTVRHGAAIKAAAFHPGGECFATAGGAAVNIWSADDGDAVNSLRTKNAVTAMMFSPDGQHLLVTGNGPAEWWNWSREEMLHQFDHQGNAVNEIAISPNGKTLLTAAVDGSVRLWSAASGEPLGVPLLHHDSVLKATFSPDSSKVLTASADRTARMWDAATGKSLTVFLHPNQVQNAVFSPDGRTVLTSCSDGQARLWDVATGKMLGMPMPQDGGVSIRLALFSKTNRFWPAPTLATGTREEIVARIQLQTALEMDASEVVNILDANQWQQRRKLLKNVDGDSQR